MHSYRYEIYYILINDLKSFLHKGYQFLQSFIKIISNIRIFLLKSYRFVKISKKKFIDFVYTSNRFKLLKKKVFNLHSYTYKNYRNVTLKSYRTNNKKKLL